MWKRQHLACKHTIFNECAVFNNLEARFAQFLDVAPDVARFAALAESYPRFRVDYLSATGAIKFYYPDFVAVQKTPKDEVNWICETGAIALPNESWSAYYFMAMWLCTPRPAPIRLYARRIPRRKRHGQATAHRATLSPLL